MHSIDFDRNYGMRVVGIDEVGYGALAGPLVVCGVLSDHSLIDARVRDSKKLNRSDRLILSNMIVSSYPHYLVTKSSEQIDNLGVLVCLYEAVTEICTYFANKADSFIFDGNRKPANLNELQTVIKGDDKSFAIAAASIVAKNARDQMMLDYHKTYPEYHFDKHVGYGTKLHISQIANLKLSPIHRKSYKIKIKIY